MEGYVFMLIVGIMAKRKSGGAFVKPLGNLLKLKNLLAY